MVSIEMKAWITTDDLRLRTGGQPLRNGQAMIEYLVAAAMLVATVTILAVLLYTFREYGGRVLDLVASEYP